ncbi:VanZ family protein [Leptothrix sp. BB-4]
MPPRAYRSSAWPLALAWVLLIVYASLHPFEGWRWPPGQPWYLRLWLPSPASSRFDLWSNFLAYQPLGFLLAMGWLRGGRLALRSVLQALLVGSLLSLLMEWAQTLLPVRVPSRIDWALNSAGTLVGALLAATAHDLGLLRAWQRWRDRWFVPHGAVGLALLLTWPVGLLFPPPVPLGLGEGLTRLTEALHEALEDSAFEGWISTPVEPPPLPPGPEMIAIALGLLAPCWIAYGVARQRHHRLVLLLGAAVMGVATTTLSTALNFGPEHALTWLTPAFWPGLALAGIAGVLLTLLPARVVAALGLVGLTVLIALASQAGTDPYLASSLARWEQGRFVRFHGVARWVGWIWPFAALAWLLAEVAQSNRRRDVG